jgi:hypothetical protein
LAARERKDKAVDRRVELREVSFTHCVRNATLQTHAPCVMHVAWQLRDITAVRYCVEAEMCACVDVYLLADTCHTHIAIHLGIAGNDENAAPAADGAASSSTATSNGSTKKKKKKTTSADGNDASADVIIHVDDDNDD